MNVMRMLGFSFVFLSFFWCQVGSGEVRLKLQDFYKDNKGVIGLADAAARGDVSRIDDFFASGEDINYIGRDGMTPLLWALMAKNKDGVRRLLELGASPDVLIKSGDSVVSLASAMADPDFLMLVLSHGGNPNILNLQDEENPTPLLVAINNFNSVNVKALIKAGADLNYCAAGGDTPVMAAAALNQWEVVYYLLEAGADYKITDRWGYTVTYFIESNGIVAPSELYNWRQKVVDFLKDKGVSVNPAPPIS